MSAHTLTHPRREEPRPRLPPVRKNGLLQLGLPHFWLLSGILAGMLGLVALVFFAYLVSR